MPRSRPDAPSARLRSLARAAGDGGPYYSIGEVSLYLGRAPATIRALVRRRKLPRQIRRYRHTWEMRLPGATVRALAKIFDRVRGGASPRIRDSHDM